MGGENRIAVARHCFGDRGDGVDEHLNEQWMVEIGPQLHQLGSVHAGRPARPGDVFDVLRAAGIAAPRRRGEHSRAADTVVSHRGDGVLDIWLPVRLPKYTGRSCSARSSAISARLMPLIGETPPKCG